MKKFIYLFLFVLSFTLRAGSGQDLNHRIQYQQSLIAAAQDFTANWADLGSPIDVRKYNNLILWLEVDINDTQNAQFRILLSHTSGGDEYQKIIQTPTSSDVKFEGEYFELNADADIKFVESFLTNGASYAQVQIKAGVVGATAGQIDSANYTLLSR